jgi:hypothetical protein
MSRQDPKQTANFQTWQEAIQGCWNVLGKDELYSYEINNWFCDRKITIKGNHLI